MPGPLDGIRVIDFTAMIAGPMATGILADQGADVIKVEPPRGGDRLRHVGSGRAGMPALFATLNRGKRSLALDVTDPRGAEIFQRLVERADLFVQNFRPGVMERMGIGEPDLRRLNRELVYVSVSGFGETGPYAQRKVIDSVMQAIAGLAASQADAEGRPHLIQNTVSDKVTALVLVQAVTAALLARARGAGGQHLRLNMLDATIAFLWPDAMQDRTFEYPEGEAPRLRRGYLDVLASADGFLAISAVTQREFEAVARAFGRPEWLRDPGLATTDARGANLPRLCQVLEEETRRRSGAELAKLFDAADVCYGLVNAPAELAGDPQVRANGTLVPVEHPVGRALHPRPPTRFEGTPTPEPGGAPLHGQHGAEILAELGVAEVEIETLRERGVLGPTTGSPDGRS